MKKQILSSLLVVVLAISFLLPLQAVAVEQEIKSVKNDETIYDTAGWKSPKSFTLSVPTSGDLIMDLKTPSSVYIAVSDKNGNELPPYDYQEQTEYGSYTGHDIGGYYLAYGNSSSTKIAHAIFYYKVSKGAYTIVLKSKYGIHSPFEMTVSIPKGFSDVEQSDYFAIPVKWAVESEITNGTSETTFSPHNTCTTAQILTFLWRANGSPKPKISNPFNDVSDSAYYVSAATWAYEKGLVDGTAFDGNSPCTRLSAVTYLWKLAGSPRASQTGFADVTSSAVDWAVTEGVTNGTSKTTFSPATTCTRAQIVTFLYRAYVD